MDPDGDGLKAEVGAPRGYQTLKALSSYHFCGIFRSYLPVDSERWKPFSRRLLDFNYDRITELLSLPMHAHPSFSVVSDNHIYTLAPLLTAREWCGLGLSIGINPLKWICCHTVESSSFSLFFWFFFSFSKTPQTKQPPLQLAKQQQQQKKSYNKIFEAILRLFGFALNLNSKVTWGFGMFHSKFIEFNKIKAKIPVVVLFVFSPLFLLYFPCFFFFFFLIF